MTAWPNIYDPVYDEVATVAQWETFRDALLYLKEQVDFYSFSYVVYGPTDGLTNGVNALRMGPAPSSLDGFNLTKVTFSHIVAGDTRATEVTIQRGRQTAPGSAHTWVDMLTTHVTIDISEYCSLDAAVPAVIDTSKDDVLEGDLWRPNIVAHQAGALGLLVTLEFEKA